MAYTTIQGTVDLYTVQENLLTNQLSDIMFSITQETKKSATLASDTSKAREEIIAEHNAGEMDDTEYADAKDNINNEYETSLAQISSWESELETEKDSIETQLQATTASKESYESMLKQNVTKAYTYGGSSTTS